MTNPRKLIRSSKKKIKAAFWNSLDVVFEKGLAFYLGYMLTSSTMVNDRTRNSFQQAFSSVGHKNTLHPADRENILTSLSSNGIGLKEEAVDELWEAWKNDDL